MQLLVSVRNIAEARSAAWGGADIIDFKNPALGPLGMVDGAVQSAIAADLAADGHHRLHLSAALGELLEWENRVVPALAHVQFAKIGLAGLRGCTGWSDRWQQIRSQIDASRPRPVDWVAVIYADHIAADAPPPMDVVEQACSTGCAGVLFDTWNKSGPVLWGHVAESQVSRLTHVAQSAGLFVALAGRLSIDDILRCQQLGADIFAVRSAACREGERNGPVSQAAVAHLVKRLAESPIVR